MHLGKETFGRDDTWLPCIACSQNGFQGSSQLSVYVISLVTTGKTLSYCL